VKRASLAACCVLVALVSERAAGDEATDLLFFSGDLISGRDYAGAGWLHAVRGLDSSGPVYLLELGRSTWDVADGQAAMGWRIAGNRTWATFLIGGEWAPGDAPAIRPSASVDVWCEPVVGWMAAAYLHATPDYLSWRAAVGLKVIQNGPWIGPEAASAAGEPRLGAHATGLPLPAGVEGRLSSGVSWRDGRAGPYVELSAWRRF
jgi:hypothetical protein